MIVVRTDAESNVIWSNLMRSAHTSVLADYELACGTARCGPPGTYIQPRAACRGQPCTRNGEAAVTGSAGLRGFVGQRQGVTLQQACDRATLESACAAMQPDLTEHLDLRACTQVPGGVVC